MISVTNSKNIFFIKDLNPTLSINCSNLLFPLFFVLFCLFCLGSDRPDWLQKKCAKIPSFSFYFLHPRTAANSETRDGPAATIVSSVNFETKCRFWPSPDRMLRNHLWPIKGSKHSLSKALASLANK